MMETTGTIITQSNPDINEIVRIYAKEKGLSETAAWAAIRGTFVPKSEVLNIIESQNRAYQGQAGYQPSRLTELIAQKSDASVEKLRLELEVKKLEILEKTEAKKVEMAERGEAREQRKMDIDEAKLVHDKEVQMRRLELEEKRQQSKDDFNQMMLLIQSGKKPDEALEMVKNQEKFYERILNERIRHTEEVGNLKENAENKLKEIKSEMDSRFEKFIKEYQSKPASDDFINKMKEYKKMQNEFLDMTFDTLEARGFDRNQLDAMRKVTNIKVKEQESSIGKLWDLTKLIYKDYIEPAADKASKELQSAPSGLENKVSHETEKRIREETESKARQITAENEVLQKQLEEEKKRIQILQDERRKLESTAHDLGIPYDDTITNQELFYWIEHQEAVLGQQKAAATERRAALEREERRARVRARVRASQEAAVPEAVPEVNEVHEVESGAQVYGVPQEQNVETPQDKINIQEELAKPRETSQETIDFIKEVGAGDGDAGEKLILPPEPKPKPEQEDEDKKPAEQPKKPKKGKRKALYSKFTVYNSDGIEIAKVESTNHKNAGLKVANQLNGTPDSPVRISVSNESGEQKQYDAYSAEIENHKGEKYNVPKVKAVVV